ncbi:MAG: PIN domain-containing protein [Candidatus Woesearchaeota archaeon]
MAKKKTSKKSGSKKQKRITSKKAEKKKFSPKNIESQIKNILTDIKPKKSKVSKVKNDKNVKPIKLSLESSLYTKIIIFDTNFLVIPERFKIDIFSEAKKMIDSADIGFMVFDKTIYELQKLASAKGKTGISAKVALELINSKGINVINTDNREYVDDMLVNYRSYLPDLKAEVIIATQDKELKERLKKNKIKVLVMANKSKLSIK